MKVKTSPFSGITILVEDQISIFPFSMLLMVLSVVSRQAGGVATVQSGYEDQFLAAISDTQANLTILEVPRSETGSKYLLRMIRTTDFNLFPSDVVEIKVLCKYTRILQRRLKVQLNYEFSMIHPIKIVHKLLFFFCKRPEYKNVSSGDY